MVVINCYNKEVIFLQNKARIKDMNTSNFREPSNNQDIVILKKLLGSLELEVMECMWGISEATVQEVVKTINRRRPIAYTSVMTVMGHLVDKGLLTRTMDGKRYTYQVAQGRDEFIESISRKMVRALVDDFGDVAIAQFLGEVDNVDAEKLKQLRKLVQEVDSENSPSE